MAGPTPQGQSKTEADLTDRTPTMTDVLFPRHRTLRMAGSPKD